MPKLMLSRAHYTSRVRPTLVLSSTSIQILALINIILIIILDQPWHSRDSIQSSIWHRTQLHAALADLESASGDGRHSSSSLDQDAN
jgi:hypothetical protein